MATRPQYGPPIVDFSALGQWPDAYAKGQERQREEAFRQVLSGWGGTDYADLVRRAAQAGSIPGIQLASQLANSAASRAHQNATLDLSRQSLANTKRHQEIIENRPQIVGNPRDGFFAIDRDGKYIGPAEPPQPQYNWNGPQGQLPDPSGRPPGPQADLVQPELGASERALAEMAPPMRGGGPQYAQAGGPPQLPPQQMAQLPPWAAGAAAPAPPRAAPPGAPATPGVRSILPPQGRPTSAPKPPTDYEWVNPAAVAAGDFSDGVRAIKGSKAEKSDSEVAARIGLGLSWLSRLDAFVDPEGNEQKGLRQRIKEGATGGPINAVKAWTGIGDPGEAVAIQASGAEALLRNLTGAGMSESEAKKYVRRYEYELGDSPQTSLRKINQLEYELRFVMETVGRGRGGVPHINPKFEKKGPTSTAPEAPPAGQREAGKVYGTPKGDLKWTGTGWVKP